MNLSTKNFILANSDSDVTRLLLGASRFPDVDMRLAAQCILARSKIKSKIPSWHLHPELEFPISLSLEQCSSEETALYKQRFVSEGIKMADLTGGLGVDSFFFSKKAGSVDYFEKNYELSTSAKANFEILKADNINVFNSNIDISFIDNKNFSYYDLIYLDPARRGKGGSRIFSISECEPNLLELKEALFKKTSSILVKISPMADISSTIDLIKETSEVHIISVDNECKEILLLLKKDKEPSAEPMIFAVGISKGETKVFSFYPSQETNAPNTIAPAGLFSEGKSSLYIFEPDRAIMKSGAFKLSASSYGLFQIALSTHLYVGHHPMEGYPGKCRKIIETFPFNKQTIKTIAEKYPKASVSSKNFPISSNDLQKRLKIADGDSYRIFGCTLSNGEKRLLIAK